MSRLLTISQRVYQLLLTNENNFIPNDTLIKEIWGSKKINDDKIKGALRVHISIARKAAEENEREILSARKEHTMGYILIKPNLNL